MSYVSIGSLGIRLLHIILATEAIYYTSPLEKEFVLEFTITIMMVNKIK